MDDFEDNLVYSGSTDGTLEVTNSFPIDDIAYIDPDEFSFGRGCTADAPPLPGSDPWSRALTSILDGRTGSRNL